jgi:hypothetical protein
LTDSLRSPHAHATFSFGDLAAARAMPGVKAIYVAADFDQLGDLPCLAALPNSDKSMTPLKPYPVLAKGAAHHVGDMVAMAVAESEREARDAVESLEVDRSPLPAAIDMREAIKSDAPQVFYDTWQILSISGWPSVDRPSCLGSIVGQPPPKYRLRVPQIGLTVRRLKHQPPVEGRHVDEQTPD